MKCCIIESPLPLQNKARGKITTQNIDKWNKKYFGWKYAIVYIYIYKLYGKVDKLSKF